MVHPLFSNIGGLDRLCRHTHTHTKKKKKEKRKNKSLFRLVEEKCLLNKVGHVSSFPLLEFSNRRVRKERGSFQHQRGAPSNDLGALICFNIEASSLGGTFLY